MIVNSIDLPTKWIEYLSKLPESGMGYQKCKFTLKDGKIVESIVLNSTHILNPKIDCNDIVDIEVE